MLHAIECSICYMLHVAGVDRALGVTVRGERVNIASTVLLLATYDTVAGHAILASDDRVT